MKLFFRLTFFLSIVVSIGCLLPSSTQADCVKCEALPLDCQPGKAAPFIGGRPCACTPSNKPQGCVLKPCQLVGKYDNPCDCTVSRGAIEDFSLCRKYRCIGNSGQCESCKDLPPDCTQYSFVNPPVNGGPDCTCINQWSPGGCTMKPCDGGFDPCVSQPGGKTAVLLFGATCPGSFNKTGGGGGKSGSGIKKYLNSFIIIWYVIIIGFRAYLN